MRDYLPERNYVEATVEVTTCLRVRMEVDTSGSEDDQRRELLAWAEGWLEERSFGNHCQELGVESRVVRWQVLKVVPAGIYQHEMTDNADFADCAAHGEGWAY